MRTVIAVLLPAVLLCGEAQADTLTASHPGLMCTSADALAALTLPDGSDRATSPHARPGDAALAQAGGCIPIPEGARLAVQTARRNTSIVTYDAGDGRGPRSFVVPNVDVTPAPGSAAAPAAPSGHACLDYDVETTLTGRMTIGSAYGEDIHTGKVGWVHWRQITLDHPICTRANPSSFEEAEHNVRNIEPAWMGSSADTIPRSGRVTLVGKLFHQENGNQMTVVLIDVDRVVSKP